MNDTVNVDSTAVLEHGSCSLYSFHSESLAKIKTFHHSSQIMSVKLFLIHQVPFQVVLCIRKKVKIVHMCENLIKQQTIAYFEILMTKFWFVGLWELNKWTDDSWQCKYLQLWIADNSIIQQCKQFQWYKTAKFKVLSNEQWENSDKQRLLPND